MIEANDRLEQEGVAADYGRVASESSNRATLLKLSRVCVFEFIGDVRVQHTAKGQREIDDLVDSFDLQDELELEARLHKAAELLDQLVDRELGIADDAAGTRDRVLASLHNDAAPAPFQEAP